MIGAIRANRRPNGRMMARYSERGAVAQFRLDSMIEFEYACCSDWSLIKILLDELEAIYWVFLSTQRHTQEANSLS